MTAFKHPVSESKKFDSVLGLVLCMLYQYLIKTAARAVETS